MGWIKCPRSISLNRQAVDRSADQLVADLGIVVVDIFCGQLAIDDGVIFIGSLCTGESGNGSIID